LAARWAIPEGSMKKRFADGRPASASIGLDRELEKIIEKILSLESPASVA
jgi:hypothetical protein